MADANVGLKLTAIEYRFLRSELEHHRDNLAKRANQKGKDYTMPPDVRERSDIRKRHASVDKLLKEI